MKIVWEVDDGYVTGKRPHYINIDIEELLEYEGDELKGYIYDIVQEEFLETINWHIENMDEILENVKKEKDS